jgi:Zn-dependent protease
MGMLFGARDSYIVLYSFGGLAVGSNDLRNRWKRIAVSLAGPLIQIIAWGGMWFGLRALPAESLRNMSPRLQFFLLQLLYINLIWPLFNLLPIWPLDGGMVSRELCTWLSPRGGLRFSLGLSVFVAGLIAVHALLAKTHGAWIIPYLPTGTYIMILFGVLAAQSWQLLRQIPAWQAPVDEYLPWENDPDAWKR